MSLNISRRKFLYSGAVAGASAAFSHSSFAGSTGRSEPPNILLISVDQWNNAVGGFHGNMHVRTPNTDRLAARGIDFKRSYTSDPVCAPARTCWMTGRMPNEHGVAGNRSKMVSSIVDIGQWFGQHGYETIHIGKWHSPGRDPRRSFNVYTGTYPSGQYCDDPVADSAQSYLLGRREEKPFFIHVSLMNPHDICQIGCLRPGQGPLPLPGEIELPPLPDNFSARPKEPDTLVKKVRNSFKRLSSRNWTENDWQLYNWMYYRYCEMVDASVGRVLDALEASGEEENTLVVFTSDHGEGLGSHGLYWKAFMYEASVRVPFVMAFPGRLAEGVANDDVFVSSVDLFPTFCDVAGMPHPKGLCGKSILARLDSGNRSNEALVASSSFGGRMVVDKQFKSIRYQGDRVLQLFDLIDDPGETVNIAEDYPRVLAQHHEILAEFESRLVPYASEADWLENS
ncbi:sulfatase family protein [Bythopirellula polymerisocia]|uniref:Choline-sulfatase n=1 Tax=Bythopirellula polymerisocia TaxID=2528003 RepID=A0A5C6CGE0_9BACT|nr:sulfatase-like hydrolase/transferase [Bythopirellula polymerisocia]TWU21799.1 Choline-sulfatase [Bythopirellula polymerisocia]